MFRVSPARVVWRGDGSMPKAACEDSPRRGVWGVVPLMERGNSGHFSALLASVALATILDVECDSTYTVGSLQENRPDKTWKK